MSTSHYTLHCGCVIVSYWDNEMPFSREATETYCAEHYKLHPRTLIWLEELRQRLDQERQAWGWCYGWAQLESYRPHTLKVRYALKNQAIVREFLHYESLMLNREKRSLT